MSSTGNGPGRVRSSRRPADGLRWLLAPAVGEVGRGHAVTLAGLRVVVGLMWLYNVAWKRAPLFGEEAGNGVYKYTVYAVEHPVFPPYSWVVENVVLPAFPLFGWGVLLVETLLAVLLLTGSWVRLAAVLGIAQSAAIGLSVAYAPEEWAWSYWLMIGAHAVLLTGASGRALGVDGVRARGAGGDALGRVWGTLALLVGLFSVVSSFGSPLAASGASLQFSSPGVGVGNYNLLGGVVLLVTGTLLLLTATGVARGAARVGAAVAVVAALSLHAQLGFTDPLLGGNPTSAAFLLSLAVVSLAVAAFPEPARRAEAARAEHTRAAT